MQPFHRTLFFISILAFLLSACKRGRYNQDREIDLDLQKEIDVLNTRLIHAISGNHQDSLFALCGDDLKATSGLKHGMNDLITFLSDIATKWPYSVKHRFYARYPEKNRAVVLTTGEGGEHDYTIRYRSPTRHSFVSIGYFEDSGRAVALLTIWNSYNGTWKLSSTRAGFVKAFQKDAVDWYYHARQQYASNDLIDAANSMTICKNLLQPGGEHWLYRLHDDITGLMAQINSSLEMDYHFPIVMEDVTTKPEIFGAKPLIFREGSYPLIAYVTKQNLHDSIALSRECDSVNAHIGDVFKDIDHYNTMIFYRAFQRIPRDSSDLVPYYGFSRKSAAAWHY